MVCELSNERSGCYKHPATWGAQRIGGEPLCRVAVLSDGNRRLPRVSQRKALTQRFDRRITIPVLPTELPSPGSFPGAACCQIAELLSYKAAPLQAWAAARRLGG